MRKTFCIFICSMTIFSTVALTGCEKKDIMSSNSKEKEKQIALSKEKENTLDLNIYFQSFKNDNTYDIAKEERVMKKDEILGETIINEIIKGPSVKSKLKPVLPRETRLLSFSIKDNIAYINFSKEANLSMTADREESCLKSIVLSITELPSVQKVKISIENKDTQIWGGNFNLSKPIGKDDILNSKNK